jgi:hypothetical protein
MNTLDTMPNWAQETIFNLALGLVEDENATWEWENESHVRILVKAHGFTYAVRDGFIG